MLSDPKNWAVVLAAGGGADPRFPSFPHKGLIEFGGKSAILRTVEACIEAGIGSITLATTNAVHNALSLSPQVKIAPAGETNIQTVRSGLSQTADSNAILFLPVDTPLIARVHLKQFIRAVAERANGEVWFAAGLSPRKDVEDFAPIAPYKFLSLKEGQFASGALFAASRKGFESALNQIEAIAGSRKSKLGMLLKVGIGTLVNYKLGRLDLKTAERLAERLLGGVAHIVPDCHPATTLDYDDATDLEFIRKNWERLNVS